MQSALTAQQSGRFAEAIALYESVIAAEPENFDALHMLGVAHYQAGDNASALTRVEMALQLRPDVEAAQHNLFLIRQAIGFLSAAGEELCARALPRVARLLADPPRAFEGLRAATEVNVVLACGAASDASVVAAMRLREHMAATLPRVWIPAELALKDASGFDLRLLDANAGMFPRTGVIVCAGVERSLMSWLPRAKPQAIALVAPAGTSHRLLLRRIRELSDEGRRPLHLFYAGVDKRSRGIAPGVEIA